MNKYLINKKGETFLLINGKIFSIYYSALFNSIERNSIQNKGVYSFISKKEFEKISFENIFSKLLKQNGNIYTAIAGDSYHSVHVKLDLTSPITGIYEVREIGYHGDCGCGSPDRVQYFTTDKDAKELMKYVLFHNKPYSCYGAKRFIITPALSGGKVIHIYL